MKRVFILFLLLGGICSIQSNAQVSDLSQEDLNELKRQSKLKVDQFNNYISFIASKKRYRSAAEQQEDSRNKDYYIEQALKLFIGKGKESKDTYGNTIPAPTMETSVINRRTNKVRINTKPVGEYLKHLKVLPYTEVIIKASDAHFTSDAKKIGENEYELTLSYAQIYIGKKGEVEVYVDKTRKTIVVHIKRHIKDGRVRWTVLLGNIKVDATE